MKKLILSILILLCVPILALADSKLSALPNNSSPTGTDLLYEAASGTSYNITLTQAKTFVLAGNTFISLGSLSATNPITYNNSTGAFGWTNSNSYITGNQTITLGGILSGSGATSITASAGSGYYMPSTSDQTTWNGKQASLSLVKGTYVDGDYCTYSSSGTLLNCNSSPSGSGTVTSVAALTLGTTGTDLSSSVANGTTTPVITLQVPTASASNRGALSSTDWSTFNGKQASLSLVKGTYVDGDYCTYSASGTLLNCNSASSSSIAIGSPVTSGTASQILATDGSTDLQNLSTATYPSLTELSYVKGVTSAIQTQLGTKAPLSSPSFTTPTLGVASATTINKVTMTAPATGSTLTIADGKTLTATNTVNLNTMTDTDWCSYTASGTALNCNNSAPQVNLSLTKGTFVDGDYCTYTASGTVLNCNSAGGGGISYPSGSGIPIVASGSSWGTTVAAPSGTVVGTTDTQTLTNKRITAMTTTINAPGATPTYNTDTYNDITFTGIAANITSMTTSASGTPVLGDILFMSMTDGGSAETIAWGANFSSSSIALPTTTVAGVTMYLVFRYNGSTWVILGQS